MSDDYSSSINDRSAVNAIPTISSVDLEIHSREINLHARILLLHLLNGGIAT